MNTKKLIIAYKYCTVGIAAALTHAIFLFLLSIIFPIWIGNILAFLIASITSYFGHALFTFRTQTKGSKFAKRWSSFRRKKIFF